MPTVTEIFQQYRDDVYRLALSYTKIRHEAEDICQSVFLKLLEHPDITPGKEKAWLMQVTANSCKNLLRSHWWKTSTPLDTNIPTPPPESEGVQEAVLALDPKYRVVVYLYYYEGWTTEEIGTLLNISQSNVSTRLYRARQILRESLKEE